MLDGGTSFVFVFRSCDVRVECVDLVLGAERDRVVIEVVVVVVEVGPSNTFELTSLEDEFEDVPVDWLGFESLFDIVYKINFISFIL
jgi:hypothetical protein